MRFLSLTTVLLVILNLAACADHNAALSANSKISEGDQLVRDGLTAYRNDHFEIAEAQFQLALEKPLKKYSPAEVQVLLGNVYKELEQFERALAAYQKSLSLNPQYHTALVNQGIVYRLLKNFDKAQESYEGALRLAPQDAHLLTSLGALSVGRKDYRAAVQYLQKSIAIEPDLNVSYGNLAYAYAEMGDAVNAQRFLDLAAQKGYENAEPLRAKINALRKTQ